MSEQETAMPCEQTTLSSSQVPQWAQDACTGIAEYETKSKTCESVGCYRWHRWCGPCVASERRDHPDDITEIRTIDGVSA